ncbi:uncharacterized protein LOC142171898 [Nicotiana tabacum]|uniref:Uncharacterized protein LOC142171898 n=1 Tax=Nicotiana tabacum TaxID=4097 RepID=A0AC58T3C1_TOBAC
MDEAKGGLFFLYGYGETGKTSIWKTLSSGIRSRGDIVLTIESSGIVSLLLLGGRTTHLRFAIPLNPIEDSTCNIKQGSPLEKLIVKAKLIIGDEAPMMHTYCFEALDQTIRDILRFKDTSSLDRPFEASGVLNHSITLKVGVLVTLLRNITSRLCNGTRLIITRLENRVIEAKILSSNMAGEKVVIIIMTLTPSDARIPFKFQR